jgi:hypothetical protein
MGRKTQFDVRGTYSASSATNTLNHAEVWLVAPLKGMAYYGTTRAALRGNYPSGVACFR